MQVGRQAHAEHRLPAQHHLLERDLRGDHTVVHHMSRATAHLWIVTPLRNQGDDRHAKLNKMFDSHPPLAERIAVLRRLEGLDPDGRGPVDETTTGVPVDLDTLSHAGSRRSEPAPVAAAASSALASSPTSTAGGAPVTVPGAGKRPPGWYRIDATTLDYWDGNAFTPWTASWNGARWVQAKGPGG